MMTCNFNVKLVFVVLLFHFSWSANLNYFDELDAVNYYENLITSEIDQAINYELPTNNEQYRPQPGGSVQDAGIWDFIIVGAGCGGAVIANRLSEIQDWNILLIEAGGPETNFSIIPAMHIYLHLSRFNWGYYSTEQKYACLGMRGNRCPIVKGRALGGSSAINYESYARGNKGDFDRWAAEGNYGWSYDEVLPYFIKSENFQAIEGDHGYHGEKSNWNVKNIRPYSDLFVDFTEGSRIVRNFKSTDYNGKDELGVFQIQVNNKQEFRHSANSAFLKPIQKRKNLKIITNAYVTKVLIDDISKLAIGVQFSRNGKLHRAKARMEVILSAGAINTPQILMLSGVGPQDHLKQMNIPVISDLPVGKTLYDHSLFYAAYIGTNVTESNPSFREQIQEFLSDFGPLTTYSNIQTIAFYQTKLETDPTYPDLEMVISIAGSLETFLVQDLRLKTETYEAIINSLHYQSIMNAFQFVLKAQSVGSVTLKSKDPYKFPNIDPNFLAEKYDVEILYQGIQTLQRIIKTEPLRKVNASLVLIDYPQCRNHRLGSKAYWICVFRLMTGSSYHQSGTCRMGVDPSTSVVNNEGIVHGFQNLRVVDASIFPSLVAGHTAAPTIMISERISDFIKLQNGIPIEPITNVIY